MKRFLSILLSVLCASTSLAATAELIIDTKTKALTTKDGGTIIDAKNVTLTLGGFTISDASGVKTIVIGATSGTKLGATGDKLGVLGATPVVRRTATTDLKQAMVDFGFYTDGGASPLNLDGGAFTSGPLSSTAGAFSLTLAVTGNATFGGTLSLTGNETIGGTLGVTGAFTGTSGTFSGGLTAFTFTGNGSALTGFTASQIPSLDTAKITTGSFDSARIPWLPFVSAESYSGANVGAKMAAAIAAVAPGGTVDATGVTGTRTITSDPIAGSTKPFTLIFPEGTTTVTGDTYWLTLQSGQYIKGAGAGKTILKAGTVVGQKDSFIRIESGAVDVGISDLTLDGSAGASSFNCAIRVSSATRPKIHDVRIFGFVSTMGNISLDNSFFADVDNVTIESERSTFPGEPHCHGLQIWNDTPTDNHHSLNNVRVRGGGFGFHFVQANRNKARGCAATNFAGGLPTLEGWNLDSSNDNDIEGSSLDRGDAGYLETSSENFPGSPPCARNHVTLRVERSSYDGASINGIDGTYNFISINNGQQNGWAGSLGPTHGVYVGENAARANIHVVAFDNQTPATQSDGVYVAAGATDTYIWAERLHGMANQIVNLGTNTSPFSWDEAALKWVQPATSITGNLDIAGDVAFPARDTTIALATSTTNVNGKNFTIRAGNGATSGGSVGGGTLTLKAGDAFTGVPELMGGDVIIQPGNNLVGAGGEGRTRIYNGTGAEVGRFDGLGNVNQTPFLILDINSGTLKRVEVGAADSAGAGFRTLRIANP